MLSSVAGERARRANFVYGSSKAGLDAFAQGLASSLVGSGARVMIVRPGFVRTRMTAGMSPAPMATTADEVAQVIVRGLEKGAEVGLGATAPAMGDGRAAPPAPGAVPPDTGLMDRRAGAGAGPESRPGRTAGEHSRPGRTAGEHSRPKEAEAAAPAVAAFDFDGTLSRRDSLLPFLVFVRGAAATARAVVAEGPRFGRVLLGKASRDEAKEALLTRLLSGAEAAQLTESGRAFAERLVARGLRPAMRHRLQWHRQAGHRVVIVSASPTIYLTTAGRRLGVDAVLATELEVDTDGRLTGKLAGRNCRGDEKANRLRAWLDASAPDRSGQLPRLWAYGDSRGDTEMLALADVAVWVGWRRYWPGRTARS